MNAIHFVALAGVFALVSSSSFAESGKSVERSLETAEKQLARCYEEALGAQAAFAHFVGKPSDSAVQDSQGAWEKYRDAEISLEMGDVPRDGEPGKKLYASIRLRLTNERIDALQRAFDYELCKHPDIRVRNATRVNFKDVVVGDTKYGDIKAGATTDYQHWELAYRYAYVSLTADSKPLKIRPIDYVGEEPLEEGKFTYVLTIENGNLDIHAVKDEEAHESGR